MGTILDILHETSERFVYESGFNVRSPQLHIHPKDRMEFTRELMGSQMFNPDNIDPEKIHFHGLELAVKVNRYCDIGNPIIIEEKEIHRIPSVNEYNHGPGRFPVHTFHHHVYNVENYHHKIWLQIKIPNPHQSASETLYAQKRMENESEKLIAKEVDHKIFLTDNHFIISISERDMYKYFFLEGVNERTLGYAADFAKSKVKDFIDKRVEEIRYKWKLEDSAQYYKENGIIPIDDTALATKVAVDLAYGSDHSVDAIMYAKGKFKNEKR